MIRLLDRNAEITTRYGGGFVQSIDGTAGGSSGGRYLDWFFYVDGVESRSGRPTRRSRAAIGSGGTTATGPRRCTFRRSSAPGRSRSPAAMTASDTRCGSSAGAAGGACCARPPPGRSAAAARAAAKSRRGAIRVLVGPWARLRSGPDRRPAREGPQIERACSPRFERRRREASCSASSISDGQPGRDARRGAGLVAATRSYDSPPVWLVTGTDRAGVRGRRGPARWRPSCATATRSPPRGGSDDRPAAAMRSALAYTPAARHPAVGRARRGDRLPRRAGGRRLPLLEPAGARRDRDRRGDRRRPRRRRRARSGRGADGADPGAADRRGQRRWSPTAATPCWPGSASGPCSARSTSPPRRSPPAR